MATQAHEFNIELTAVPREYVSDALRALLHSIFFHRLLVNVTPRELNVFDTTVSITDSDEVGLLIEDRVEEFMHNITQSRNIRQGKIAVFFYEKRPKKNWFQFSKSEELVCWEQWVITIHLSDQDRLKSLKSVERQLASRLMDILKMANDNKEHIPSITTTEGNPFPFQIALPLQSESWGAMIKRLLVTDAPPTETTGRGSSRSQQHNVPALPRPTRSSSSGRPTH